MAPVLGRTRLVAQGLLTRPYATPLAAVAAFGAMQGQDLPGVLASVALRTPSNSIDEVLGALNDGTVVRGYPMRGTVFLMPAADALWITQLCAMISLRAAMSRRSELHGAVFDAVRDLTATLLADGPLSRAALFEGWEAAGFSKAEGRGYHLLFTLIAEGTVCYGPWNGTDQDVVLTGDWLPAGSDLASRFNGDRDAATAELLRRYLTTHGPATIRDFAWWTKLTLAEIRRGLALIQHEFDTDGGQDHRRPGRPSSGHGHRFPGGARLRDHRSDCSGEPSYWRRGLLEETAGLGRRTAAPLLLPGFDEFILGYQDRLFAMTLDHHHRLVPGNNGVFRRSVVRGGKVVGTWTRSGRPGKRSLAVDPFIELSPAAEKRLTKLFAEFPFVAP